LPSYLEKNCTKPIELVLKKFDLSKEERDLELEKIKTETQSKIDSLKDDNQIKVLTSENEKLIHSDFKKGFIRAETISFEDFVKFSGWQECRNKGKMRLEGKDYIVKDGDILNFRFNT